MFFSFLGWMEPKLLLGSSVYNPKLRQNAIKSASQSGRDKFEAQWRGFMQRAALREEKTKKEQDLSVDATSSAVVRQCVVIIEGDPHPGALKGRMSFQSFNPSVDKLNEEEARLPQPAAETTMPGNQNTNVSVRENNSSVEGSECADVEFTGSVKRKQSKVICEAQYPKNSPKNDQDDKESLRSNSLGSFKKPSGGDKLDWNVLRPSSVKQSR